VAARRAPKPARMLAERLAQACWRRPGRGGVLTDAGG
jgi:hypothetical protein